MQTTVQACLGSSRDFLSQSVGAQGVQQLEAGRREEYMRNVSSLEGLTSLTAAVSRTSAIMLSEVAYHLACTCLWLPQC